MYLKPVITVLSFFIIISLSLSTSWAEISEKEAVAMCYEYVKNNVYKKIVTIKQPNKVTVSPTRPTQYSVSWTDQNFIIFKNKKGHNNVSLALCVVAKYRGSYKLMEVWASAKPFVQFFEHLGTEKIE